MNAEHIAAIRELFDAAEERDLLLWLENGWAIDARLGRITRDHEDIDVAFPKEREDDYLSLIESLGYARHESTDYGFLRWRGEVLLDSEPCWKKAGEYGFENFPTGSCPLAKEGILQGYAVRCVSWEATYFEILGYIREIPEQQWRPKDFQSLRLVQSSLEEGTKRAMEKRHAETA